MDKLEKTIHDNKTHGLNNPETYVFTHNRFNKWTVWIFSHLNKNQIYKMQYRDSPHHEIEIVVSFSYLNVFKSHEQTEDYHMRKPNDENFLSEIGAKNIFMWEKSIYFWNKWYECKIF